MKPIANFLLVLGACWSLATSSYAGPVNINTATAESIAENLNGIGITKARAIVAFRNANGPFRDADALTQVTGIGERTVAMNSENILIEVAQEEEQ